MERGFKFAVQVCGSTRRAWRTYVPYRYLCSTRGFSAAEEASTPQELASGDDQRQMITGGEAKRTPSLSLPTISPPPELQAALKKVLSRHPSRSLIADGQMLSRHLLSRIPPSMVEESKIKKGTVKVVPVNPWTDKQEVSKDIVQAVLRYGKREAVAYAASRLQATYGVTLRVLNEIAQRVPSFQPETLLDFGSGLGTATWAAHRLWGNSLYEYNCVDTSQEMGELAATLRRGGEEVDLEAPTAGEIKETIPGVNFRQYLPVSNKVQYDIVVAAYALGDLPNLKLRRMTIDSLWKKTNHYLVIIEPGNMAGFRNVIEARGIVLDASRSRSKSQHGSGEGLEDHQDDRKGNVFAPCPHNLTCPLALPNGHIPCYFAQRVQLAFSEQHTLKHKGFRIEGFSYVVLKKGSLGNVGSQGRILQPIRKRSRHLICKTCCPSGKIEEVILTKTKHGDLYKQGRRTEWGDLLPLPKKEKKNYDDSR